MAYGRAPIFELALISLRAARITSVFHFLSLLSLLVLSSLPLYQKEAGHQQCLHTPSALPSNYRKGEEVLCSLNVWILPNNVESI